MSFVIALSTVHAGTSETEQKINDAWLDGKLDTAILFTEHLNALKIDTEVKNGVAFLSGEVNSDVSKDLATEVAISVEGIKDVKNNLKVNAPKQKGKEKDSVTDNLTDASISTAITTKLMLNSNIDSWDIDVDTSNRMVTLNGSVPSGEQKTLVEKIAENTSDVKKVNNKLEVR